MRTNTTGIMHFMAPQLNESISAPDETGTEWTCERPSLPYAPCGLSSVTEGQCNRDLITCPLKPVITKASRQALSVR